MTEKQQAFDLANAALDKPHIDPDGDIAMLARQFLRAREEIDAMRAALEPFGEYAKHLDDKPDEEAITTHWEGIHKWTHVRVNDYRRARAVLANFTVPGKPKMTAS